MHLELVGDILLVADRYATPQVTVVDTATGGIRGSFARKGGGPAEVDQLFMMYAESHVPPRVWLYDLRGSRLSLWALDAGVPDEPLRSFRLDLNGAVPRPFIVNDGIIYTTKYDDVVLYLADSLGHIRSEVGTVPYPTTDYLYDAVVNVAHPVMDPARQRIALAYLHTNRVDLYEATGVHIATATAPVEVPDLQLTRVDGERRFERPLPRTYGPGTATAEFVYYLYCPQCDTSEPPPYRQVQVFNWSGQFIMTLDIGATTWAIEVRPDDDVLYAAVVDPYPLVVAYSLPFELRAPGNQGSASP